MTFVHMHDGETVYYEDTCEVCASLESEDKSTDAVTRENRMDILGEIHESFQLGVLIGTMRNKGTSEADVRAMVEFALSMCKGVK